MVINLSRLVSAMSKEGGREKESTTMMMMMLESEIIFYFDIYSNAISLNAGRVEL
jgi:hypothetical protein